jgi:hypothetical protein
MVEIHHTQKSLLRFTVSWFGKIQNDLYIVPERGDASGRDTVAQEIQLGDGEHALLQVEGQAVGGKDGEQRVEAGPVLLCGFAEDLVII